jgi:hypothetical protein
MQFYLSFWCDIWSVILREKQKLWLFGNGLLRKIFGPKRDEVTGKPRRIHKEALHECTAQQILFGLSNQGKRDGRGKLHVWETRKVYIGIRWGDLKKRGHLEDLGVDRRTLLRLIFKEGGEETLDWFDLSQNIHGGWIF